MIDSEFKYRGDTIRLSGFENCSVSRSIHDSGQFYELDFLEALETHTDRSKWVVDVGAHIGNHTIYWSKIHKMKVLAFEPNPNTYTQLKRNLEYNDVNDLVSALNVAVGSEQGLVSFTPLQNEDPGTYSMMRSANDASFRCRVVRLDDYLEYFATRKPGVIKIDVEGAEGEVIKGAMKVLQTYRPVVTTETMKGEELDLISALLSPLGYSPVGIYNSTPTIIWAARNLGSDTGSSLCKELLQITRYGVVSGMLANSAQISTRNAQEKLKAHESRKTEKKTVSKSPKPPKGPESSGKVPDVKKPDVKKNEP